MDHKNLSISEARNELTSMPEFFEQHPGAVAITRRGEPVIALMSWALYESLLETIEVMLDPDAMEAIRQDLKDIKAGKHVEGVLLSDVEKELGF